MQQVGDLVRDWLTDSGINSSILETLRVVAPLTNLPPSIDRIFTGELSVGRLPGASPAENIAIIARGLFYNELIFSNSYRDTSHLSLYAYAEGTNFRDNFGVTHAVNERALIDAALNSVGFTITRKIEQTGLTATANLGSTYWSISTHGVIFDTHPTRFVTEDWVGLMFSNWEHESGWETGGSYIDPDVNSDGIVNPENTSEQVYVTPSWFDSQFENLHSPIVTIVGCLVGSSEFPEMLLSHGATSVISSLRSIYFHSGGWSNVRFAQLLTQNYSCGDVLRTVINETSEMYSLDYSTINSEWSLQFVLFGDPDVTMYKPGDPKPTLTPLTMTAKDGHSPGSLRNTVLVLGNNRTSTDDWENLSISYLYFDINDNFSTFLNWMWAFPLVVVESGVISSGSTSLSLNASIFDNYIKQGGVMAIFGAANGFATSSNVSWLPMTTSVDPSGNGNSINYPQPTHPLVSIIHNLNTTKNSQGSFSQSNQHYFTIARRNSLAVWLAASVGDGKLTIATITPDLDNDTEVYQNLLYWVGVSSLKLSDYQGMDSQKQGQSINFGLFITDVQHYSVVNAVVNVSIGDIVTTAISLGEGWYAVNLTAEQTQNFLGDIEVHIQIEKVGYDPLSTSLTLTVRSSLIPEWLEPYLPFILLGIIAIVAIYFGSRPAKKKKKVIPIPSLDNHKRINRPRKLKIPIPEREIDQEIPRPPNQVEPSISDDSQEIFATPPQRASDERSTLEVPPSTKCPICGTFMAPSDTMCNICGFVAK
jgi:hypothetical protein